MSRRVGFVVMTLAIILVLGGLTVLSNFGSSPDFQSAASSESSQPIENSTVISSSLGEAVDYLIQGVNPNTGMIPETPTSTTYWLYSDNFLASLALEQSAMNHSFDLQKFALSNSSASTFGELIARSVSENLALFKINNIENQYLVLNASEPCLFNASQDYTLGTLDGATFKVTINNGTGLLSEKQYADIAFLNAICLHRQGNPAGALAAYNVGKEMFHGKGLEDTVYEQSCQQTCQYQTFKLALYIYASELLNQPFPELALSILLSMQDSAGGFYTGYGANLSHEGTSTNTETTSLAVLALNSVFTG
jgi:hypothetical protein